MPGWLIQASQVSYSALALSADATLVWPFEAQVNTPIATNIIDVTPSAGSLSVLLPDATKGTTGITIVFVNRGGHTFTVKDNAGGTITTITTGGDAKQIYLRSNTSQAGSWGAIVLGAVT